LHGNGFLWILFLLCAIIIQIVLLNLLVSILGDTFGRVTSLAEQSLLQELCSMISENEFILDRKKVFGSFKYIVVAKLEKAAGSSDPMLANMKAMLQQVISESQKVNKQMNNQLREEMIANSKSLEVKLAKSSS
jgi:hypothetical protein